MLNLNPVMPEIILSTIGLVVLLAELVFRHKGPLALMTMFGALVTLFIITHHTSGIAFNGMFIADSYSLLFKVIFMICLILSVMISISLLNVERALYGEYFALLIFATTGMMIMVSAGDLIILYVGLELMALSTYILAGFLRNNSRSTESALKYFLMGAFSSAILLFGITLLYGLTGTTDLRIISTYIVGHKLMSSYPLILAAIMFITAFGYKVSAVPFHMWAPDVYEGAPTSVTAFMSVGPKIAGLAVFGRVFYTVFQSSHMDWVMIVSVLSVATMALGNIVALSQTNIKRMLAYSSIAHAGYALLGIIPGTSQALAGMTNYLFIYTFMNIGAFAIIILLRTEGFSGENITDYIGLSKTHPLIALAMLIVMFSLTGIPPTAGFIGKFFLFATLIHGGYAVLAVLAVCFSVISAFFYLRIVMYMYMKEPECDVSISLSKPLAVSIIITVFVILYIGIFPQSFIAYAINAISSL